MGRASFDYRELPPKALSKAKSQAKADYSEFTDIELFNRLKALRLKLAQEAQVPAFVVFSDATLHDMAARHPQTEADFLKVNGVGPAKLERYGAAFLEVLRDEAV